MGTIYDKLNHLKNSKNAIKAALEAKGKEPTEALSTYAQSITELDNEEQVSYVLANADGTQKVYAQLSSKDPITLTATENDIRLGSTAITNEGYIEGAKDIPAYYSSYGEKVLQAGEEATITIHEYDYKSLMVTIAPYNTNIDGSTAIKYVSVDNAIYEAKDTTKLGDITTDTENERINLGISVTEKSVLRYFVVREEV